MAALAGDAVATALSAGDDAAALAADASGPSSAFGVARA
jgi:hypothetical protein